MIKKIFDAALSVGTDAIYVTVFDAHESLVSLFHQFGFRTGAIKTTPNGVEQVLVRLLTDLTGDPIADYPFIHTAGHTGWLLAIYPEYHTRLLPDSILKNEPLELVQDVSPTNTVHKAYIAGLSLTRMKRGDIVILYRTSDKQSHAHYRSVVSSVCVVEEVRSRKNFANADDFLAYTAPRSAYTEQELRERYNSGKRLYVAKMTYNAAFARRITRGRLIEDGIVSVQPRWDLRRLTPEQLHRILEIGEVNARLIVD